MLKRTLSGGFGLLLLVSLIWPGLVYAQNSVDFEGTLRTTISASGLDKPVRVSQVLEITNNTDADTPTSIEVPAYGNSLTNISASYKDVSTRLTASYKEDNLTILLNTDRSFKGKDKKWTINLSYNSVLIGKFSGSQAIFIGPTSAEISGIKIVSETKQFELGLSIGPVMRVGAVRPESILSTDKRVFTWREAGNIGYTTGVVVGDTSLVKVTTTANLKNNFPWWRSYKIFLPPETNQQKTVLESISPQPTNIRTDVDGNIIAEYRLRPFGRANVEAITWAQVNNHNYAFGVAEAEMTEEEQQKYNFYLGGGWPKISLSQDSASLKGLELIDAIVAELKDLNQSDSPSFSTITDNNNRSVGTLRANGTPARAVYGTLSSDGESGGYKYHVWTEAYIGNLGWITVDPWFETYSPQTADVRYVALVIDSQDSKMPDWNIENSKIEYTSGDGLPEVAGEASLKSTTYMLFPGVGIRSTRLIMPLGVITDFVGLEFEGDRINRLGSLAPGQVFISRDVLVGGKAFNQFNVNHGVLDNEGSLSVVGSTVSSISWLPMIIGVIMLIGLIVAIVILKRNHKTSSKPTKLKSSNTALNHIEVEDKFGQVDAKDDKPKKPYLWRTRKSRPGIDSPALPSLHSHPVSDNSHQPGTTFHPQPSSQQPIINTSAPVQEPNTDLDSSSINHSKLVQ